MLPFPVVSLCPCILGHADHNRGAEALHKGGQQRLCQAVARFDGDCGIFARYSANVDGDCRRRGDGNPGPGATLSVQDNGSLIGSMLIVCKCIMLLCCAIGEINETSKSRHCDFICWCEDDVGRYVQHACYIDRLVHGAR